MADETKKSESTQASSQTATKELPFEVPPLFGKYSFKEVVVQDPGLVKYINLTPIFIPHSSGRYTSKAFQKSKVNIVERFVNNMMRTEHATGEKAHMIGVVEKAFDIIEKRTKQNPIQILVKAIENSSPREEITRLQYGGISVPKAVDVSSARRVDIALRNLCKGILKSSHKNKKRLEMCVADELIAAAENNMNSFGVSKKEEMERVAASAR
ncbi:MAG: 30S ribosomal protein S7 [Thermoplasmata archaeon]